MKRREFLTVSALSSLGLGLGAGNLSFAGPISRPASRGQNRNRKVLIAGGGYGTAFIRYMAELTGRERPRICYLPTASADGQGGSLRFFQNCATLNVEPHVQNSFVASYRQEQSWGSGGLRESMRFSGRRGTRASCSAAPAPARYAGSRKEPRTRAPRS